jgi:hypothetical protein
LKKAEGNANEKLLKHTFFFIITLFLGLGARWLKRKNKILSASKR